MKSKIAAAILSIISASALAEVSIKNPKIYNNFVYGWIQVEKTPRLLGTNCEDGVLLEVTKDGSLFFSPTLKFPGPIKDEQTLVEALCRQKALMRATRSNIETIHVIAAPVHVIK